LAQQPLLNELESASAMEPVQVHTRELRPQGWIAARLVRRNKWVLGIALPYLDKQWARRWMKLAPGPLALVLAILVWLYIVNLLPAWWGAFGGPSHKPIDGGTFFLLWVATAAYVLSGLATSLLYIAHVLSNPSLDARSQTRWVLAIAYGFPVGMPLYWRKHIACEGQGGTADQRQETRDQRSE
jgi:hypothetical protein